MENKKLQIETESRKITSVMRMKEVCAKFDILTDFVVTIIGDDFDEWVCMICRRDCHELAGDLIEY